MIVVVNFRIHTVSIYVLLFIAHPHIISLGEMQEKGPEPRKDGPLWFNTKVS